MVDLEQRSLYDLSMSAGGFGHSCLVTQVGGGGVRFRSISGQYFVCRGATHIIRRCLCVASAREIAGTVYGHGRHLEVGTPLMRIVLLGSLGFLILTLYRILIEP